MIKAKKSLGQHFLFNRFYLDNIVRCSIDVYKDLEQLVRIVEIGPGLGTLTQLLRDKKDVICVEKDYELAGQLQSKWANVECICDDALKFDFHQIANVKDSILVANLPYNVSALLILNFLRNPFVKRYCVLVQKEMADRLAAKPNTKDYSGLSVLAQTFAQVKLCFNIPGNIFKPKTKVESTFVVLEARENVECDFAKLEYVVKMCFANRRKMLRNVIDDEMKVVFEKLSIPVDIRAEDLHVEQFVIISRHVK